ncbi:MAG TPA: redoxin domain-containing protein [Vicinamibacterales bacterium]|nr:redoxin domain-containing protein [Vicinamibacterales bacterium]
MVINPRAGEPLELHVLKTTISIGNAEDNDFVVRQTTVSQHHAMLARKDGHFELSDLSSTNGTFVNGRRIDKRALVKIGDELWFGGTRFVLANPVIGGGAGEVPEPRATRRKTFSSRAALELALLALAIGFGSAQYLAYLLYHEQNRLILAEAVPLPPPPVHPAAARVQSAAPSPAPVAPAAPGPIAKRAEPAAVPAPPRPAMSRAASVSSPTAELASIPAPKPPDRGNDELAGAVSLMRLLPGSGKHVGEPAGEFQLTDLAGTPVSLTAMRGKVVLLTFWATWCGVCRRELPNLENLYKNLKGHDDFAVLTINLDQRSESVPPFVRTNDYQFPVLLDADNRVSTAYDVSGIPANFIIDRAGKIIWSCAGGIDWSDPTLQQAVEKLL